ncbi:uncharacterized protein CG1161-like, partial [Teleopsis dalmanni]
MAHKRLLLYIGLLAICYLIGVTWAESAALSNLTSSNVPASNANVSHNVDVANVSKIISSTIATNVLASSTAASPNSTTPKTCVCDGALLPRLSENGKQLEICQECKCKHKARNTTLTKVVVIIVIWIISILVIYMLFLMCLDPLLNKRVKANYQEHTNEDDDTTSTTPPMPSSRNQELNSRANVLNRVGHQQDKW